MTSVVDTSVKYFHSRMAGAPVLRGQAGSRTTILDACLKDGWGIQTASSVVVSGGVCTMTFPLDHAALVDCVIINAGASVGALNGEQKVTFSGPNTLKFATAAANGTATGTITCKMAPLGWNKSFTGTNLAVYKSADVAANGQFLRVIDTDTKLTRVIGYENMTAISTGTGLFPTAAQYSGGSSWVKSALAGTTPVEWAIVGDSRGFYHMTAPYMGNGAGYETYVHGPLWWFGDMLPLSRAPDPFATALVGQPSQVGTSASCSGTSVVYSLGSGGLSSMFAPRDVTGLGTSLSLVAAPYNVLTADPGFDPVAGRVLASAIAVVTTGTTQKRADYPGLVIGQATYMEQVLPHLSTYKLGSPERSYLAMLCSSTDDSLTGLNLSSLDITGPWR